MKRAEKFGGGGHGQAAAFRLNNKQELEDLLLKEFQTQKPSIKKKLKQ